MEESHKGVSSTSGAKKKSSLDVDIEEDFVTSWKLTTDGKEGMDFSNESPSKARKTKFNLNKFDDIDFGEDFSKMPSFKMNMDMPNLDFNTPRKTPEDTKQKLRKDPVQGKKEGKQGLFSFNFEFDELESFGIDTNLLKSEKKSDGGNKRLDCVDNKANTPDSKCNSFNSISEVKFHGCISPKNASKSNEEISSDSGKGLRHVDVASHTNHSAFNEENTQGTFCLEKEKTVTQENNTKQKSDGHIEQPDMMTSGKLTLENPIESLLENVGNLTAHESIAKLDKSAESHGSPDSRGSYCVKTSNSEYPPTCVGESSDDASKSEARQNNKNKAIKERAADGDIKPTHVMNVENAPISTLSSKSGCLQTKSSDDNHRSIPMNPPLTLREEPSTSSGQVLRKVCLNEGADKKGSSLLGYDRKKKENPISIATKQPNDYKNPMSSLSSIGGHALLKHSIGSIKKSEISLKCGTRLKKLMTPLANPTNKRKSNLLGVSDIDVESCSRKTPIVTFSEFTEKSVSSSLSLKRRSFQGSTTDPTVLKSLKPFPQSPAKKRICMDKPLNTNLLSVFNSEELEDHVVDIPVEPQEASLVDMIPSKMDMLDSEVPIVLEEDGHVQKAEACAKELDDMYKMLKKKHEEAKEILVRVIVNNNHMLMLNHPINEQKICSLQKMAHSLISLEL